MASRQYLESTGTPSISPPYAAAWEVTADAIQRSMGEAKAGSPMTTVFANGAGAANNDVLLVQWVSGLLAAGVTFTVGAAITAQIRCKETNGTDNYVLVVGVRVVSEDGTTLRQNLRNPAAQSTEFATSLTNRTFSTTIAAGYVSVAGDRIVVEVGFRATSGGSVANGGVSVGSDSGTDLPADETTTTANDPWIEFADTISYLSGSVAGTSTSVRPTRRRRR